VGVYQSGRGEIPDRGERRILLLPPLVPKRVKKTNSVEEGKEKWFLMMQIEEGRLLKG